MAAHCSFRLIASARRAIESTGFRSGSINRIQMMEASAFPADPLYAWDCAIEGAPSSTFLLEQREQKGLGDVLLANGLPGFESGVHGGDLSDNICSRPGS